MPQQNSAGTHGQTLLKPLPRSPRGVSGGRPHSSSHPTVLGLSPSFPQGDTLDLLLWLYTVEQDYGMVLL